MKHRAGARRLARRPLAEAAGALVVSAALLAGLACAGRAAPGWRLDPDAEVLPVRQPAPAPAVAEAAASEEPSVRSVVILLPDADGGVGVVEVANASGSATLSRAREAVAFDDLGHPFIAEDAQIRQGDGPTLDAEPQAPQGFTVYFRSGSARLASESEAAWAGIVNTLAARDVPEVTVVAHADRAGDERSNLELSERRAVAIRDALVRAGLDADLMEVAWRGETRPAVPTADGVPEARNRRAEIRVR